MKQLEEFARVAGFLPEATLLISGDGEVLAANQRIAPLLEGMQSGELIGRRLAEVTDQDAERLAAWLRSCARSRNPTPGSLRLIGKDGVRIPCRADGAVFEPASDDGPAAILVRLTPQRRAVDSFLTLNLRIEELTSQIARRHRAEEALRTEREWLRVTLESIGDAVIATDREGRVTFLNPVAENLTGWVGGAAAGRHIDEVFVIINEYTRDPAPNPVDTVLSKGITVALANHTLLIRRDGSECAIDDTAAPIRDPRGEMQGVVLVFHEITERRRLERQLRDADRRKDEFLAMLAHELRNPLAPLRSGIDVIRLARGDARAVEQVAQMMGRQVQHLSRLVDDLLDVSRITRGSIELRRERLTLQPILQHAVEMVEQPTAAHGGALTLAMPPQPLLLEGDGTRLAQVFVNLLSNAVKFTEPGGRIAVTAELHGDRIQVTVADSGIGIPPDYLGVIFELFAQADRSLDRSNGGLGLGLPVAKRITELHGGTLEARSEGLGHGSEFVVSLPSLAAASQEAVEIEDTESLETVRSQGLADGSPSPSEQRQDQAAQRKRVLIVDDNRDAAEMLAMLVRLWGHPVAMAHDGREALTVAAEYLPGVVLLDLGLPELDGYEVARRMRRHPDLAKALLVAVSGYGRPEDLQRTRGAGFDEHLVKPVDPQVLAELLAGPAD